MKPRVLVLTETYLPGYLAGGPVKSLASLVHTLGDEIDWHILTRDRDFRAAQSYGSVPMDQWATVGKAQVFYATPGKQALAQWLNVIRRTPHEVLYLNSYFSPSFSWIPLVALRAGLIPRQPVVIAPRGEFSAGAIALKAWKKRPAMAVFKALGLHSKVLWHASTDAEAADISRESGASPAEIYVARNLATPLSAFGAVTESLPITFGASLRVVFASRITRKKNLAFALRVLKRCSIPLHFSIIGPAEDAEFWQECRTQIAELPANVAIEVMGPMTPESLARELPKYDVFFLPTLGENYGHAIVEAWQAGLLVLTSDQTPWRNLQARGLGWDLPLHDEVAFSEALQLAHSRTLSVREEQRKACLAFGVSVVEDPEAVAANRDMFLRVAAIAT